MPGIVAVITAPLTPWSTHDGVAPDHLLAQAMLGLVLLLEELLDGSEGVPWDHRRRYARWARHGEHVLDLLLRVDFPEASARALLEGYPRVMSPERSALGWGELRPRLLAALAFDVEVDGDASERTLDEIVSLRAERGPLRWAAPETTSPTGDAPLVRTSERDRDLLRDLLGHHIFARPPVAPPTPPMPVRSAARRASSTSARATRR